MTTKDKLLKMKDLEKFSEVFSEKVNDALNSLNKKIEENPNSNRFIQIGDVIVCGEKNNLTTLDKILKNKDMKIYLDEIKLNSHKKSVGYLG